MTDRRRMAVSVALVVWAVPQPAYAHTGHCSGAETFTSVGLGALLGLALFRPWRRSAMSAASKLTRWSVPVALAGVLTLGACGSDSSSSGPRPSTNARLEIVQPAPNSTVGPNFTLNLNLVGATVVPEDVTNRAVRGDEGHIHVTMDGKLISMTYGTSQEMKDVPPGPHNIQAEFVGTDHAPFANRVIVAVAFQVAPDVPAPATGPATGSASPS